MVEGIDGHMTRYWRHVTKRKGNRESWNFMEGHGNLREKGNVYIYYLVANQASRFLASDFCVLVCFVCLVFFRFTNRLVFWRIVTKSRRNFRTYFSPNNQATP